MLSKRHSAGKPDELDEQQSDRMTKDVWVEDVLRGNETLEWVLQREAQADSSRRAERWKMWAARQAKVRCRADKHCLCLGRLRYCRWAVKDRRRDGRLQISPELK